MFPFENLKTIHLRTKRNLRGDDDLTSMGSILNVRPRRKRRTHSHQSYWDHLIRKTHSILSESQSSLQEAVHNAGEALVASEDALFCQTLNFNHWVSRSSQSRATEPVEVIDFSTFKWAQTSDIECDCESDHSTVPYLFDQSRT
jgi:hypothetical protein